jgi:hypothetical protein
MDKIWLRVIDSLELEFQPQQTLQPPLQSPDGTGGFQLLTFLELDSFGRDEFEKQRVVLSKTLVQFSIVAQFPDMDGSDQVHHDAIFLIGGSVPHNGRVEGHGASSFVPHHSNVLTARSFVLVRYRSFTRGRVIGGWLRLGSWRVRREMRVAQRPSC